MQWLSNRLDRPLVIPDLAALGFRLMGARVLPGEAGPAAQVMYEDAADTRITVYLRVDASAETRFFRQENRIGAFYWADEGLACAAPIDADQGRTDQ